MKQFEKEISNLKNLLEDIKDKLKFNINDYEDLNNAFKILDKEITDFQSNLKNYY